MDATMRLRARLQNQLSQRINAVLPEAAATVWDHGAVVVAIEQLTFRPAGGIAEGWRNLSSFEGVVRAELRADGIDDLAVEPLVADLVTQPLFVVEAVGTPVGALTETARADLIEMRDTLRDMQVVTGLRFRVSGLIVRREGEVSRPAAMVGAAPAIGPAYAADYQDIGGADEIL